MTYANNNDGPTTVFWVYPIQLNANIFDQFYQAWQLLHCILGGICS